MDNFDPPVVTVKQSVVPILVRIKLEELFTVIDPDQESEVTRLQFRDNGPGGGTFMFGNQIQAANQWHEVTASQFDNVTYKGGSAFGTESISIRVFDGFFWSNVGTGPVTTGNESPIVTGEPGRVGAMERVRIDKFFSVFDADGDSMQEYRIIDSRDNLGGGRFVLRDVEFPQNELITISASDLPNLLYQGADTGRETEQIRVMAHDGYSWSEMSTFEMATSAQSTITPTTETILANTKRPATDFFDVTDEDGDPVLRYWANDYRINANGGYWEYKGERMTSAVWFTVPAHSIDELFYVGASVGPQSEDVGIQVWDGAEHSPITRFEIKTVVPPRISARDAEIQATHFLNMETGGVSNTPGQKEPGTPIFDFTGSDQDEVTEYSFIERRANSRGGGFVFKGERLAANAWFTIDAADLDQLEYEGAEWGPQNEGISARAGASGVWSDRVDMTFDTLENLYRPDLRVFNVDARLGTVMRLETMFTWSDQDGDRMRSFSIYDTGDGAESGYFSVDGIEMPARTWFTLDFDQVENVRYHMSNVANTEKFRMRISDGRKKSTLETAELVSVARPEIDANDNDVSVDSIERVLASSLIQQTDSGPSLVQYQVYDENDFFRSGRLELDGNDLQQGVMHTLTADEFGRLVFKGAETDYGRQLDPMLVRGDNGVTGWTEWERVNVNTDPVGNRALTSGTQWFNTGPSDKTVVTYMFIDGNEVDSPYPPLPTYYVCPPQPNPDQECNNPHALNVFQREMIRESLEIYETYADIDFVEVPWSADAGEAALTFGATDLPAGTGAWAYYPSGSPASGMGAKPGDVWFNNGTAAAPIYLPSSFPDVSLGSSMRATTYHEVGHAVGFKHPHSLDPILSVFTDFDYNTVMSYQHDNFQNPFPVPYPEEPSTLMLYDIVELQRLYGVNEEYRTGNDHYGNLISGSAPHFFDNDEQHQTTLYDAGGLDTLNYTNHEFGETIDLREGSWSSVNGVQQSLRISYGTIIENARGGSEDDNIRGNEIRNLLYGNQGNDVLRGAGGNDTLRGGSGDDTYIWSLGDGRDAVREQGSGGIDNLEVYDPSGSLDSLEDDFTFRRLGDTLRIDFTFNQGEAQGTFRVVDFDNSESQTELLRIHDLVGNQIGNDIDLLSIYGTATVAAQRYFVTDVEGANGGFIASPVT